MELRKENATRKCISMYYQPLSLFLDVVKNRGAFIIPHANSKQQWISYR